MKEFNLIECLKEEQELLMANIYVARNENNVGTYKNLINALRDVTSLIHNEEKMNYDRVYDLYFETDRELTTIYFQGGVHRYKGVNYDFIVSEIIKMIKDKNVNIYGDIRTMGLLLADTLYGSNMVVKDTNILVFNASINSENGGKKIEHKQSYRESKIK